jgi:hypothetical protein
LQQNQLQQQNQQQQQQNQLQQRPQQERQLLHDTTVKTATAAKLKNTFFHPLI